MLRRLLIANRGEIAVRIIRTCAELGVETVAVYSDVDRTARHVAEADQAVAIGPATAADSYLSVARIIDAARESRADSIHPGYGFLSENADLADACRAANLTWVGPAPDVIRRLGSKIEARRVATAAGVPVVPGGEPADQSADGVRAAAQDTGYPVLLKASAGGGGKGMRVARTDDELSAAIGAARREALSAFGDGTLYVERVLERPRHIEVQIAGDHHGQVVHLFERDCSIQRRHQKVIEETPSTTLTDDMRERLTTAAVAAARAAGYDNVGTVEFLVEGHGDDVRFYFLEMNTRLQVEHPVTELVTGVDLVRAQLEIAARGGLPWTQADLGARGHAIECRVYAEDPANGFLPQAGRITLYREPTGPGLRVDAGVSEGSDVSVHYDPLLAKLIAFGETRDLARRRAIAALRRYAVLGTVTNITFLRRVLEHPRFAAGTCDTGFLDTERASLLEGCPDRAAFAAVTAVAARIGRTRAAPRRPGDDTSGRPPDPWSRLSDWRL